VTASQPATAVAAFAGTTVDDLVILAVLCTVRRTTGSPGARVIIAGRYAGTAAILAIALIDAADLPIVPDRWAGRHPPRVPTCCFTCTDEILGKHNAGHNGRSLWVVAFAGILEPTGP
jgi:hypothetical protein